ncbi:MAG: YkgJ family cysteine cluster protein [Bacteroidota bacterium]
MSSNPQLENIEKAFYSDGYRFGMKVVEAGMEKSALFSALKEMYGAVDSFIESLLEFANRQGQLISCKKGCEWCCHQPVFAMDYELAYLNQFIQKNMSRRGLTEINKRANEKQKKLDALEKEDLLNSKYPCPLLKDGSCLAYEARPMACRIYLSIDVTTCLSFYKIPEDKTNYPALLDFPMRAGRMMSEGFKAALKTNRVVTKEYRIEEKLCS